MRGIKHLCDHRAILYRSVPTRNAFGDTVPGWAALPSPDGVNCRPNQAWSGSLQDHGPGEQQGNARQWFLVTGWEPMERDVLSVVTGPEAPVLLRVVSATEPTAPKLVHHVEVNVEVWEGPLA